MRASRVRWPWILLGLAAVLLFGSTVHQELGDMGGDSALYVLLAKSLAQGHGYRDLADPWQRPHVLCPPGLPLLLAPIVALVGPYAFWPMHALVAGCAVAAVLLAVWLLRTLGEPTAAWLAGWGAVIHPTVLATLVCLWTEFPYAAASLIALLGLHRARETTATKNRWVWMAIAGTMAATMTRTVGVALFFAGTCSLCVSGRDGRRSGRRRVWLTWLLLSATPFALWMVRNALAGHTVWEEYGYWREMQLLDPRHPEQGAITLMALVRRIWSALFVYTDLLGRLIGGLVWPTALTIVIVGLIVTGWSVVWARRRSVVEWYVVWYGLVLLVYPWREERFLLPLLPFGWYYLWIGGRWCVAQIIAPIWRRTLRVSLMTGLALTLVAHGMASAQVVRLQHQDYRLRSVQWAHMHGMEGLRAYPQLLVAMTDDLELLQWIRHHHTGRVVIFSSKPAITALLAAQASRYILSTTDVGVWRATIGEQPFPSMVIADQWTKRSLTWVWPLLAAHPEFFEPIHTVGSATLYRIAVERWPVRNDDAHRD